MSILRAARWPAAALSFALVAPSCARPEPDGARAKAAAARGAPAEPGAAASLRALRELARASLSRRGVATPSADAVELTIDPALQAIAEAEVAALSASEATKSASVVALDPASGDVLALAGREGGAPAADLAARAAYVPGSVMKTFGVAAALDAGTVREGQTFSGDGGSFPYDGRTIRDVSPHGTMTVSDVLSFSSNVGTAKIFDTLGVEGLARAFERLRFGARPDVELESAAAGELPRGAELTRGRAAAVAYGGDGRASSLQVAAAFAAVVNGGEYVAPGLVRQATGAGGEVLFRRRPVRSPALRPETSRAMRELLQDAVHRDDGTGRRARVAGFRVAGKTGTWAVEGAGGAPNFAHASFVGAVPAGRPRLVVMVAVDTTDESYGGGTIAAPAFARVAERAVAKLGVGPGATGPDELVRARAPRPEVSAAKRCRRPWAPTARPRRGAPRRRARRPAR